MNTSEETVHEFFERLARQGSMQESLPRRVHPSLETFLTVTCEEDLDEMDDGDISRNYTPEEMRRQLDFSFYVGDRLSPTDLETDIVKCRIGTDAIWEKRNRYGVYEREAILLDVPGQSDSIDAVVTRAQRGFEVLNTSKLMFVDVDFNLESDASKKQQTSSVVEKATQWAQQHGWTIRIYRTYAGLRLMVTQKPCVSVDESFDAICAAVGADPVFRELCHIQGCFRARLTPKPERCDIIDPEFFFPFDSPLEERYFKHWLEAYTKASTKFATCRLVATVGSGVIHDELRSLVALHDDLTKVNSDRLLR